MEMTCTQCTARFRADVELPLRSPVRLICPSCGKQIVMRPAEQPAAPKRIPMRAVIADEPRPFRDFLVSELQASGFEVKVFDSGEGVVEYIRGSRSRLVILNVYLKGGRLGVDICEEIRSDSSLSETRVVLIGALFRANRFRANPTNLYGADEYIEEMIPSRELQQIIQKLFPSATPEPDTQPSEYEEARRLARLILSDIVIYHAEKVDSGIRNGTFFDLLSDEIAEGRDYYESRIPGRVRKDTDFFTETLDQFVQMKREELERSQSRAERK